jgi:class 3 adenylate cyclase
MQGDNQALAVSEVLPRHFRHDARNHLSQVIGHVDLLREDAADLGHAELPELLDKLASASAAAVENLNTFGTHPGEPANLEVLEAELCRYVAGVLDLARDVERHAIEQAHQLLPDVQRVKAAATALRTLARTLIPGRDFEPEPLPAAVPLPAVRRQTPERTAHPAGEGDTSILIVDDNEGNREILFRLLDRQGWGLIGAATVDEAIDLIRKNSFDLILLDMILGDEDGLTVLRRVKAAPKYQHIPIVVISALDDLSRVVNCIEAGAEDYLTKPFNAVLLRARLKILLERKRLLDGTQRRARELEAAFEDVARQKKISEELLNNILPQRVATELRETGSASPMYFEDVTIVFTDFVGFTLSTENLPAEELVEVLHGYFTAFDNIMERYGLEKLKTIGDSYMFASGLPMRSPSHPVDAVMAALEIVEVVRRMAGKQVDWRVRVGVHSGPVIAGVVGIRKFAFDIWGDSVNLASRMESSGAPDRVNVSDRTYARVKDFFACESRGAVTTKDHREVNMYFVNGLAPSLKGDLTVLPPPSFARRYRTYFQKDLTAFPPHLVKPAVAPDLASVK